MPPKRQHFYYNNKYPLIAFVLATLEADYVSSVELNSVIIDKKTLASYTETYLNFNLNGNYKFYRTL